MNKKNLLEKELSNLYAINKQINHYFNGSEISFLAEKHQLLLMDYLKVICESENTTSDILEKLNINPTNTQDAIIKEITENLNDIVIEKIGTEMKSSGYLMSLNRLISYQLANFENIKFINDGDIDFESLENLREKFQSHKTKLFTATSPINQ